MNLDHDKEAFAELYIQGKTDRHSRHLKYTLRCLLMMIWERVVRVQLFAKQKLQKSLEQNASLLMEAVAKEMNV